MTTHEPKAVREIHEIRERLYEEQKDWTDAQLLEHYRRVGEKYAKEHGLHLVPHKPPPPRRKAG